MLQGLLFLFLFIFIWSKLFLLGLFCSTVEPKFFWVYESLSLHKYNSQHDLSYVLKAIIILVYRIC